MENAEEETPSPELPPMRFGFTNEANQSESKSENSIGPKLLAPEPDQQMRTRSRDLMAFGINCDPQSALSPSRDLHTCGLD